MPASLKSSTKNHGWHLKCHPSCLAWISNLTKFDPHDIRFLITSFHKSALAATLSIQLRVVNPIICAFQPLNLFESKLLWFPPPTQTQQIANPNMDYEQYQLIDDRALTYSHPMKRVYQMVRPTTINDPCIQPQIEDG